MTRVKNTSWRIEAIIFWVLAIVDWMGVVMLVMFIPPTIALKYFEKGSLEIVGVILASAITATLVIAIPISHPEWWFDRTPRLRNQIIVED